jgi:hypothetical protein
MQSKAIKTWPFQASEPTGPSYPIALEEHSDGTYKIPNTWFTLANLRELAAIIQRIEDKPF